MKLKPITSRSIRKGLQHFCSVPIAAATIFILPVLKEKAVPSPGLSVLISQILQTARKTCISVTIVATRRTFLQEIPTIFN